MSLRFASFSQNQFNLLKGVARPNLLRAEIAPERDIKPGEPDPGATGGRYETTRPQQAFSSAAETAKYGESQALHQAERNIQSAQAVLENIADIYDQVQTKLDRMQTLADTDSSAMSLTDRSLMDIEYQSLKDEIRDLVNNNPFDGKYYIGANGSDNVQNLIPELQRITLIATRVERDLVSRQANHDQLNGDSVAGAASNNGRYVVFESDATNATAGDTNGQRDIFLKDRFNGTIRNITGGGTGGDSFGATISANGRYVTFLSDATGLVAGTTPGQRNAYLYDRNTNTTTLISADDFGVEANADTNSVTISGDGRFIGFTTAADNLIGAGNDLNGVSDAFVKDRATGIVERVSIGTGAIEGNGDTDAIALSYDGNQVAFVSRSTNLEATDVTAFRDVYAHDRTTGVTRHISQSTLGTGSDGDASLNSLDITNNGQRVLYASEASNLHANDINGATRDIFLDNNGTTQIVSHAAGSPNSGNGVSANASMRANGSRIAFSSDASDLIAGDTNGRADIFVYNVNNGQINRITSEYNDDLGTNTNINATSLQPNMSFNGRFITFHGAENALSPQDSNGASDIYIHNYRNSTATSRFFENQDIAFDFLYESTAGLPITSIDYLLGSITGGVTTPHNISGSLPPIAGGITNRTRGNIDFDVSLPDGTNGNTVNITMTLTVNGTPHSIEFEPFRIGQIRENQQLQAIRIDGEEVDNTTLTHSRSISHEDILSGTSILGQDRMDFTSFHLNDHSLDPAFAGSHLANEEARQLASNMLKDVIDYVDEGAARVNAALNNSEHGKTLNNLAGFEEALSSETYYRYNTPETDFYEGEAELYDEFSIDQSVNYALSVSDYIEDVLDMITDDGASYDPKNPRTGLYKEFNSNPLLKDWEAAYETESEKFVAAE